MTNLTAIESAKKEPKEIQLTLKETALMREALEFNGRIEKVQASFFLPKYRAAKLAAKGKKLAELFWGQMEEAYPETTYGNWKYNSTSRCIAPHEQSAHPLEELLRSITGQN